MRSRPYVGNVSIGTVVGVFLRPDLGAIPIQVDEVLAVAGKGLKGDRYFEQIGPGVEPEPKREVTLIEVEAIDAARRDHQVHLSLGDPRRNIVTRDVALNPLVGREFQVGEATLRGVKLCEPCAHLAKLVGDKRTIKALIHRGGLRAEIVSGGVIRTGDPVSTARMADLEQEVL